MNFFDKEISSVPRDVVITVQLRIGCDFFPSKDRFFTISSKSGKKIFRANSRNFNSCCIENGKMIDNSELFEKLLNAKRRATIWCYCRSNRIIFCTNWRNLLIFLANFLTNLNFFQISFNFQLFKNYWLTKNISQQT